ncbi:MAG: hypothetical protein ACKOOH_02005 [Cyanobium sp.]
MADRRQRIHELVVALMAHQGEIQLLSEEGSPLGPPQGEGTAHPGEAMKWSRRVIRQYQALVHSVVTLDALIDQEFQRETSPGPSTTSSHLGKGRAH